MEEVMINQYYLSGLQKRLWLAGKGKGMFYRRCLVQVTGELDRDRLEGSLRLVVRKHSVLRTSYMVSPDFVFPLQSICEDGRGFDLQFNDKAGLGWTIQTAGEQYPERNGLYGYFDQGDERPLKVRLVKLGRDRHVLIVVLSSMAADTCGLINLVKEIRDAYERPEDFETEDAIQYYHYSEWHNELVEAGDEESSVFWKDYPFLSCNEVSLSFGNRLEAGSGRFTPAVRKTAVDGELAAGLRRLAMTLGTDVQGVLFAAFCQLMRYHVGKENFVVGYTGNNRVYEELKPVIGAMGTALPVIVDLGGDLTFAELVGQLRLEVEKVKAREEYFSWGTKEADHADAANSWLKLGFEYIIVADEYESFSIRDITGLGNRCDCQLTCMDFGDALRLDLYYDTGLLSEKSMDVLAGQLSGLLGAVLAEPDRRIADLDILSEKERTTILHFFNKTVQVEYPNRTVVQAFEETVRLYPDARAVEHAGREMSYAQLNAQANLLAGKLIGEYGLRPGEPVVVRLPRSDKTIVAYLGILKAGGCYLPVDMQFPRERVKFMVGDSGARVTILGEAESDWPGGQLVYDQAIGGDDPGNPCVAMDGEYPVYIIYTSGSTGKPKGVEVTHGSLLNYVNWFLSISRMERDSRTLLFSSTAFDLCYTSLWTALLSGHTLCIMKEEAHPDAGELVKMLAEQRINYIKCTPSHFHMILHAPELEAALPQFHLGLIVLGGEQIIPADLEKYFRQRPDVKFLHHYGPTETTIGTIAELIDINNFQAFRKKVALGRPIMNSSVYIIDSSRRLCPIGFAGEIAVAGKGLALGYLGQPGLTAAKFVRNPFREYGRMYLTGDVGRWMPDGRIEFLGRKDDQLKIRGYRVELGEVEQALLRMEGVRAAVVLALKGSDNGLELTAYLQTERPVNQDRLAAGLKDFLPAYMIPTRVIRVAEIPLTPNGKVDKQVLAAMDAGDGEGTDYVAPATIREQKMAMIYKEVLGKERIGMRDDFFKSGGHSLKAVQIISRAYKHMGIKLRLSDIFENPTIEGLLRNVFGSGEAVYEPIAPVAEQDHYEVSHAQKRLWFLSQFEENKTSYNVHFAYWIDGALDVLALERALAWIIGRHEILRTTFLMTAGGLRQEVNGYDKGKHALRITDLRGERDPAAVAEVCSKVALDQVFDLREGPLLRAELLQAGDDRFAFLLTLHHIITDGWSMRILMNELMIAYASFAREDAGVPALRPLKIQYKDYAAWHNQRVAGSEEAYWQKKLANPPGLVNLPYERPGQGGHQEECPYPVQEMGKERTEALRELALQYHSTLSNIMLTAYALLINKLTGQQDFLIGVGHANRNHGDAEGLIGFFVNLLALRIQITEEATLESCIRDITRDCIEAYDHSNYPFDLLVEKFCQERYSTRQPLVNVLYDFKGYADLMLENEAYSGDEQIRVSDMPRIRNIPKFEITLFVTETAEGVRYYFEYNDKCFSSRTMNDLYRFYNELLSLIIEMNINETV